MGPDTILLAVLVVLALIILALLWRQQAQLAQPAPAEIGNLQQTLTGLAQTVGELRGGLSGLLQTQQQLGQQVAQSREDGQTKLASLAETVRGIQNAQQQFAEYLERVQQGLSTSLASSQTALSAEITRTRELLTEVRTVEEAQQQYQQRAAEAIRRLEGIIAGSKSRGMAGENVLAEMLSQLGPGLFEPNLSIGGKTVEFALRLPHGRFIPIDSKWPAAELVDQLQTVEDTEQRKRLLKDLQQQIARKARDMRKYLDLDHTVSLGIVAVPDAVYELCGTAHAEAYREGVVIVPYGQALPYLLGLLQLVQRFASEVDLARLSGAVAAITEALQKLDEEVEGRLSRSLTQLENSRGELRKLVGQARQGTERLSAVSQEGIEAAPPQEDSVSSSGEDDSLSAPATRDTA